MTTQSPETWASFAARLRANLKRLSPEEQQRFLVSLDAREIEALEKFWQVFAHEYQTPPGDPWSIWLLLGGRGAGKTRSGAEWVRGLALGGTLGAAAISPIALVGETEHDVREVMIEGVSGILAAHGRNERPTWIPSRRRLEWTNGVVAQAFSAEDPDSLRGPQFAAAWCDELAKWRDDESAIALLDAIGADPAEILAP